MSPEPLTLILARNFVTSVNTPAIVLIPGGGLNFYNEAAGSLLGVRFEELGRVETKVWYERFGPFREDGTQESFDELALTLAVRQRQSAAYARFFLRSDTGGRHEVEITVLPLVSEGEYHGVICFFWPIANGGAPKDA